MSPLTRYAIAGCSPSLQVVKMRRAEIGDFANRLGALVATRPGAIPQWTLEACVRMKRK